MNAATRDHLQYIIDAKYSECPTCHNKSLYAAIPVLKSSENDEDEASDKVQVVTQFDVFCDSCGDYIAKWKRYSGFSGK